MLTAMFRLQDMAFIFINDEAKSVLKNAKALKPLYFRAFAFAFGGEAGIRTLDTLRYT